MKNDRKAWRDKAFPVARLAAATALVMLVTGAVQPVQAALIRLSGTIDRTLYDVPQRYEAGTPFRAVLDVDLMSDVSTGAPTFAVFKAPEGYKIVVGDPLTGDTATTVFRRGGANTQTRLVV